MAPPILLAILFLGIAIATYRDIKIREVPDTVSYGLIFIGLLGNIIIAIIQNDPMVFAYSLAGFGIGAIIGAVMFYSKQWGGGDAKLIMGVGAILGAWIGNYSMLEFFLLLIVCGAVYGVIVTLWLALITHRKKFIPKFREVLRSPKVHKSRIAAVITGVFFIIAILLVPPNMKILAGFLMLGMYLLLYSWIFSKAVEQSVFTKSLPTGKLTEGDWIAEDIILNKKVLISKDNLGLTKEQIAMLKKNKIKSVIVKEGIPFVPAFLIAYIILLILEFNIGNDWLLRLFGF